MTSGQLDLNVVHPAGKQQNTAVYINQRSKYGYQSYLPSDFE